MYKLINYERKKNSYRTILTFFWDLIYFTDFINKFFKKNFINVFYWTLGLHSPQIFQRTWAKNKWSLSDTKYFRTLPENNKSRRPIELFQLCRNFCKSLSAARGLYNAKKIRYFLLYTELKITPFFTDHTVWYWFLQTIHASQNLQFSMWNSLKFKIILL